jgi:sarcosine oxidase
MDVDFDVVIVGCGLAGSATAWAATRRDASILVLERFDQGHANGSSHGSARIVRRAYGDALYTRLTGEAFELWREVEVQSGRTLLRMLGGLDFGASRDADQVSAHLTACQVSHEVLDAAEAERRWPGMRFEGRVVFHDQAGTVDAQGAVDAMTDLARQCGAEVRHGLAATGLGVEGDRARVRLSDGSSVTAGCVVVAAGAWVGPLVGTLVELPPLEVSQQQAFHFPRLDPTAPPWPSVIHVRGGHDEYYHLAGGRDGGPGDDRKVAEHYYGGPTTGDTRDHVIDPESRRRIVEYVQRWLPGLDPTPRGETSCLYTKTPTEDFLIDRVGPIVVCSPCSGHGGKFAPLIGEYNARLALRDGQIPDRFRLAYHATAQPGSVSF